MAPAASVSRLCCSCLAILQPAAVAQRLSAMRIMRHVGRGKGETGKGQVGSDELSESMPAWGKGRAKIPYLHTLSRRPDERDPLSPPSLFLACSAPHWLLPCSCLSCPLSLGDLVGLGCTLSSRLSSWRCFSFLSLASMM